MRNSLARFRPVAVGAVTVWLALFVYVSISTSNAAPAKVDSADSTSVDSVSLSPAEALKALRSHGIDIEPDAIRTVPAPGSAGRAAKTWAVTPIANGGMCGATAKLLVFCGRSAEAVRAGRASATEYPPDKFVKDLPGTGQAIVEPSRDSGVRVGIAPPAAVDVVVRNKSNVLIRREPVERGLYEIEVPPQGSGSRVEFRNAEGSAVSDQPA